MRLAPLIVVLVAACARNDGGKAGGTQGEGEPCQTDAVCVDGLACAGDGTCQPAGLPGTYRKGAPCPGTDWCAFGLVCDQDGACVDDGAPGTSAHGEECVDTAACRAGLDCVDGRCVGFEVPPWPGVSCPEAPPTTDPFVARLRVPRGDPDERYYDLPFPNDLRVRTGRLDLTGYAEPGPLLPELGDPVRTLLDLAATTSGFAGSGSVVFQLTHAPVWETAHADLGTIGLVDLTPGETYGEHVPATMSGSPSRRQYVCANWLALTPLAGRPLTPGHTYAAWMTRGVLRDGDQVPLQPDADLQALLSATPPSDAALTAAWEVYAPLRTWVATDGIGGDSLASATVFTIADPLAQLTDLVDAVRDAPVADVLEVHRCDGGPGPYDDGAGRGCSPTSPSYDELQGVLGLPRFRTGDAPFRAVDDGGRVEARPVLEGVDPVPFVLTVPTTPMPADGWPLVIVAHGPDDDSRRFVRDGLAERLAGVDLDARTRVGMAVIAIDGVVRGGRASGATRSDWVAIDPRTYDPERLLLNRHNPAAFTGNALQAIADLAAVGRWAEGHVWSAGDSPTRATLRFDPANVMAVGHDTGAWSVVPWTVVDPLPRALVLASTSGALPTTIAEGAHPFDMAGPTQVAWAAAEVDRDHVLLTVEATLFDVVDPMAWYRRIHADAPIAPRHVLHVVGRGGAVPEDLQDAAARATVVRQLANGQVPIEGLPEFGESIPPNIHGITAAAVVSGRGDDGLFADPEVVRQVDTFLATTVHDGAPTVPF